ncbi:hypothetical protein [Levilactobacillus enshiensis]|uniref:hypothetical protein n=1 Tax=Levilactobacillus enshiensis TaxID=2590213 RepID=UPI00117BD337|nr:hypothetical protein [Levilactobacillus enshiensis]
MNKLIITTVLVAGLAGGLIPTTTAHAAKWTTGAPKAIQGAWTKQARVNGYLGYQTTVTTDAVMLSPKWLYAMSDRGHRDYGGNHLAYQRTGNAYRLKSYDRLEQQWTYTRIHRAGKTITAQEYGYRKAGRAFRTTTRPSYRLHYSPKLSTPLLK